MNCHMYRMLRDTCSQAQNIGNGYNQSRKRQRQVANNIFSIVSIFFVCHLPYRATSMYLTFVDRRVVGQLGLERYLLILYSARICFYINHAINPLIYNFVSTKFRRAFINVCCSSSRCKFVSERGERRNSSSLREQKYTFKTGTATPNQIDSHFWESAKSVYYIIDLKRCDLTNISFRYLFLIRDFTCSVVYKPQ